MNRYLLLRDNKQSGPYTVAELAQKGIKAYDLVWLDGRSAAWRYPSEIDELKAYAPAVEEQPYDRFYKKPSLQPAEQKEQQHQAVESKIPRQEKESPVVFQDKSTSRPVSEQLPVEIPSIQHDQPRKIYVTLPLTATKNNSKQVPAQVVRQTAPPIQLPIEAPANNQNIPRPAKSAEESIPARAIIAEAPAVAAEMQAYAPVPADKKPVAKTWTNTPAAELVSSFSDRIGSGLASSRNSAPRKNEVRGQATKTRMVMTAIVAVCLLLGGVVIGLAISNSKNESQARLDQLVKQIQDRSSANTASVLPSASVATEPVADNFDEKPAEQQSEPVAVIEKPRPVRQAAVIPETGSPVNGSPNQAQAQSPSTQEKIVTNDPAPVKEIKATVNPDAEEARKNIRQLVSLQNNKYKTGVLGGISELELTISNKSEYELDVVEVEVEYLGPERRVIRTQTIVFNNVKPGKTSMQEVPKSSRGVSVNTSIRAIRSKTLGVASNGL